MDTLNQLYNAIEARTNNIRTEHADWLCRMGCDNCCQRLAEIPTLTAAEWAYLKTALDGLPVNVLTSIHEAMISLASDAQRPIVCPLLNKTAGTCRVYTHRPAACRTYGFYRQRDNGLYCKDIENRLSNGDWSTVVWGNHATIERSLQGCGEVKKLTEWFLASS